MDRYRPTVAEVDLEAIRANVGVLKPPRAKLMAVVKADAYGHGLLPVARAVLEAGATWLGVALVEEGLRLREAGIRAPILVLSELPPGSERDAIAAGITPALYTDEGLERLGQALKATGRRVRVHVKVDTGLHRVGRYPPDTTVDFVRRTTEAGLVVEGLWTHFTRSEDDEEMTRAQLRCLMAVADALKEVHVAARCVHAANSGAVILYPETHLDLVRPGVALYGLEPGPPGLAERAGVRPALTWRSRVAMVKRLPAREALSYGHRYQLERESTVATVPVGYADGYPRVLSSRADVLIGGRRCRVAGAVTMDQILIDCGNAEVRPGDEVVLLGPQGDDVISAEELAEAAATIGREVVCSIGTRVPREYRGGSGGVTPAAPDPAPAS